MPGKPRVFITRPIPDQILSKLEEICDVEMWHTSEIPAPVSYTHLTLPTIYSV